MYTCRESVEPSQMPSQRSVEVWYVEKSVAYEPEQRAGTHLHLGSSIEYFIIFEHPSVIYGTSSRGGQAAHKNLPSASLIKL